MIWNNLNEDFADIIIKKFGLHNRMQIDDKSNLKSENVKDNKL